MSKRLMLFFKKKKSFRLFGFKSQLLFIVISNVQRLLHFVSGVIVIQVNVSCTGTIHLLSLYHWVKHKETDIYW